MVHMVLINQLIDCIKMQNTRAAAATTSEEGQAMLVVQPVAQPASNIPSENNFPSSGSLFVESTQVRIQRDAGLLGAHCIGHQCL